MSDRPVTDRQIPFETLLVHRAWVRVLVRRVVADGASAEDLEQETWLTALRSPPRHGTALRAWFARVVRSRAVSRHRTDSRRVAREQAVARSGVSPATADLVARAELEQRVARAVLGLGEPYREALLLRYYEELPPRAVAERLGVPVETARTRIWRGVAKLRSALEEHEGTHLRVAFAPLLELPLGRGLVWKGAMVGSAKNAGVAAAIVIGLGAALWGMSTMVGRGVDGAAAGVAVADDPGGASRHHAMATFGDDEQESADAASGAVVGLGDVPLAARSALTMTLREATTQRPAAGVDVVLADAEGREVVAHTGATGTVAFTGVPPGIGYTLTAARDGSATVRRAGLTLPHGDVLALGTVWMSAPLTLATLVVDTAGRPVAGAHVEVRESVDSEDLTWGWRVRRFTQRRDEFSVVTEPIATAETGEDGAATVEGLAAGEYRVLAKAPERGRGAARGVRVVPGASASPVRVVLLPAHVLRGRVVDQTGAAIAGAELVLRRPDDWGRQGDRLITSADVWRAESAEDGSFVVRDAPAGVLWITVRTALGVSEGGRVIVPGDAERTVVVARGGITLAGHVRDSDGRPIAGARLTLSANLVAQDGYIDPPASFRRNTVSGEDGSYQLPELPPAESLELRVEASGFVARDRGTRRDVPPLRSDSGVVVEYDVVLERGLAATLRVVDEGGAPVPGAALALHIVGHGWPAPAPIVAVTGPDGVALVRGLQHDPYVVIADVAGYLQPDLPPDAEALAEVRGPLPASVIVTPGATSVQVVRVAPGASVRGVVRDVAGRPVKGATVQLQGSESVTATDSVGVFVLRGLRPTYRAVLEARLGAGVMATSRQLALKAGETVDAGELTMAAGRTAAGTVHSASGERLVGATVRVVRGEAPPIGSVRPGYYNYDVLSVLALAPRVPVAPDGNFSVGSLAPGVVTVVAEAEGHAINWSAALDLADGDQRAVEIVLTPGRRIAGSVRFADGSPAPYVQVEALLEGTRDAFGLPVPSAVTGPDGRFELTGLHEFPYQLLVRGPSVVPHLVEAVRAGEADRTINVARAAAIRGVVLDETGIGLPGVRLEVRGRLAMDPKPEVRTAADGRFELAGLARATHTVVAIPPDGYEMVDSRVHLNAGQADATLHARRTTAETLGAEDDDDGARAALTLRLLLPDGTAVDENGPDIDFAVRKAGSTDEWNRGGVSVSTSEGSHGLTDRIPGRYDVRITVDGFLPIRREALETGVTGTVIQLDRGASLAGIVLDERGQPVADAWVTSEGSAPGADEVTSQRIDTDDQGRFTLRGLERVPQRVSVTSDHHAWTTIDNVRVGSDGLRLVVADGLPLTGRVVGSAGAPLENIRVRALNTHDEAAARSVRTAADGTFRIPRLVGGTAYRLELRRPGNDDVNAPYVHPENVIPGAEPIDIVAPW